MIVFAQLLLSWISKCYSIAIHKIWVQTMPNILVLQFILGSTKIRLDLQDGGSSFYLVFTQCKAEQPLQGMELHIKKRNTKRLKHTGNQFTKQKLQIKDAC